MFKIIIIILSAFCIFQTSFAETCPTPKELSLGQFREWQPVDINNGTTVSIQRLENFKKEVAQLALAEWMDGAPEGSGHCYYYNAVNQYYLDIFLAKQNLKPQPAATGWEFVGSRDVMQCYPSSNFCPFIFEDSFHFMPNYH